MRKYLVKRNWRNRQKPIFHLWNGTDTECHQVSSGAFKLEKYETVWLEQEPPICMMCQHKGSTADLPERNWDFLAEATRPAPDPRQMTIE